MANFGDQCAAGGGNAFVNDGSFMEMFKRLQEQQKEKGEESTTAEDKEEPNSASKPSASGGPEASVSDSNNRTHETEASDKDKASDKKSAERTAVTTDPPLVKASQGVLMGKRKALMKSIELREKRKRRREELEQEQQLAQEQDDKDKSSAWRAYMAQVKAYEAQNCTDSEGHRRPLVK